MSSNASPPKPTNIKMNPRFSFSGSTSKGFKAGVNRRGSNCTAVTEESPATTSDEYDGSSNSLESGSSGSYESSSEYDDSGTSESSSDEDSESDSQYDDLMEILPINNNIVRKASGLCSIAKEIQPFTSAPMPLHGVVEESEGDYSPTEEEYLSPKESLSDGNGSGSCYGELVSPIVSSRHGTPRTSSSSPNVAPTSSEELMSSTYADDLCRDASMQEESSRSSSSFEDAKAGDNSSMTKASEVYQMESEEGDSFSGYRDVNNVLPATMPRGVPTSAHLQVEIDQPRTQSLTLIPYEMNEIQSFQSKVLLMDKIQGEENSSSFSDEDSDDYEESSSDGSASDSEEGENSSTGYSDLVNDLPIKLARQDKDLRPQLKRKDAACISPSVSSNSLAKVADPPEPMEEESASTDEGSEEESSSYDSDESSGSEYSSGEDMDTDDDSSEWSSSDESSFDDLMQEMPIAPGRAGPPASSQRHVGASSITTPAVPMPVPVPVPVPSAEIPCEDPPMEGLAMLQNIRAELQKVGQMIVKNKDGEKFLQRAQILASINYLASNVPRCVLEDLGQEIRDQLNSQEEKKKRKQKTKSVMNSLLRISVDDASVASDISHHEEHNTFAGDKSFADSIETASDEEEEDDFFPETSTPETLRRKYTLENFMPLKTPMGIRESRLSLNSTHSSGSIFAPKLRKNSSEERKGASRTYSFSSMSSSSESSDDWGDSTLPILTYFECALLFVDISGFTKLSTLLDPENLSKVINTYFEVRVCCRICANYWCSELTCLFHCGVSVACEPC
jgi:hypothetical protein